MCMSEFDEPNPVDSVIKILTVKVYPIVCVLSHGVIQRIVLFSFQGVLRNGKT